ncbi:hypothetical protein GGI07_000495 [Coemansia sp. Benny D115]|nr:hypothetical protein GGI07_000495 [Coemansia sp. Benny D115]
MPIIGGHKTLSSLLNLSGGSQKNDSRTAFSPYTGSLSNEGAERDSRGGSSIDFESPTSTLPAAMSIGTSITLNMRYVAKDMWRKVTFPPGITVTQARDICMLRFNIWQQTLALNDNAELAVLLADDVGEQAKQPAFGENNMDIQSTHSTGTISRSGGATAGFTGIAGANGSQKSQTQNQFREQYGLFWTSAGHWLEADEMLNTYPLRKGEVLELQHIVDFIPLQPHEFKFSYAETAIYYMQASDSSGTEAKWQLYWAVLRCRVLRLYKKKGMQEADVVIDLARLFRLTDQDGRSWPKNSSKLGFEAPNMQALLESLPSAPPSIRDTGALAVQFQSLTDDKPQTFVFRSVSVYDYDVWHRTLRHTLSSGASGTTGGGGAGGMGIGAGCSMSASASISGTSQNSHCAPYSMQSSDALVPSTIPPGSGGGGSGSGSAGPNNSQLASLQAIASGVVDTNKPHDSPNQPLFSVLSPQLSQRLRQSTERHEGYVNRKSPDGYGFRRRYCVLTQNALYGFLYADECKGLDDAQMTEACDFAVSLDPKTVAIEAIAWNGRYLLRVFGPESSCLRDKPWATSLQPTDNSRIQCTDILATAAQAAIKQFGSTFGMLPDSRELVRLMVDDHEDGLLWAVCFNSISGLQITSQSKVVVSARRTQLLADSKSHANLHLVGSQSTGDFYPAATAKQAATAGDCDMASSATTSPNHRVCRQQSLNEFFVSQADPIPIPIPSTQPQQPAPVVKKHKQPQEPASPLEKLAEAKSTAAAPKWIPLSIDKYVQEEEDRRHQGVACEGGSTPVLPLPASHGGTSGVGSSMGRRALRPKASDVSDSDQRSNGSGNMLFQGYSGSRPPHKFNWFKRRGSTSK